MTTETLCITKPKHTTLFRRCNNVFDVQTTLCRRQNDVLCFTGSPEMWAKTHRLIKNIYLNVRLYKWIHCVPTCVFEEHYEMTLLSKTFEQQSFVRITIHITFPIIRCHGNDQHQIAYHYCDQNGRYLSRAISHDCQPLSDYDYLWMVGVGVDCVNRELSYF